MEPLEGAGGALTRLPGANPFAAAQPGLGPGRLPAPAPSCSRSLPRERHSQTPRLYRPRRCESLWRESDRVNRNLAPTSIAWVKPERTGRRCRMAAPGSIAVWPGIPRPRTHCFFPRRCPPNPMLAVEDRQACDTRRGGCRPGRASGSRNQEAHVPSAPASQAKADSLPSRLDPRRDF